MVFFYHLRWIAGEPTLYWLGVDWQLVLKRWDFGVCLFFVLSGYLLSSRFWDAQSISALPDLRQYAVRRLSRIIPAYWIVLFVFGVLAPSTYTFWGSSSLILQALALHTFADFSYMGVLPVLWSIGIEVQFYVLLPLLFVLGHRCVGSHVKALPLAIAAIIWAADLAWSALVGSVVGNVPDKFLARSHSFAVHGSIFAYLKWFGIGMLAAWVTRTHTTARLTQRTWNLLFMTAVAGLLWVLAFSSEGEWRTVSRFGWPLGVLTSAVLVVSSTRSTTGALLFGGRIMRWLGQVSYGLYLWHWPIQKAVFGGTLPNRLGETAAFWVGGAVSLALTLAISTAVYVYVEQPAIEWSRRQKGVLSAIRSILGEWKSRTGTGATQTVADTQPVCATSGR